MRRNQTVINMVAATIVVMLGVGAVYFPMLGGKSEVSSVDFDSQLSLARAQAQSFTPLRPISSAIEVTSAGFTRVDGVERWRVGVQLSSGTFMWIEQVDGQINQSIDQWSRNGERVGEVEILGAPRVQWQSGSWRALTFSDEGVALGVFGRASFAELAALAQSLSGA